LPARFLPAALAAQVQELCLRDVIGEEQPGQRAAGAGDDNRLTWA
jgi:hypothetical protein